MKKPMSDEVKLEPCPTPWCDGGGGEPYVFERRFDCLGVYCPTCWVSTPYFKSQQQAIECWNTRPTTAPPFPELVKRVAAALPLSDLGNDCHRSGCLLAGRSIHLALAAIEATRPAAVTGQLEPQGEDSCLTAFVRESNRIEGIADTTAAHVKAHRKFLAGPVHIPALIELVSVLQPDARFRNKAGVPGVRVGNHVAPPSGPDIEGNLRSILAMRDPWEQHIAYETLHPFTDGNGRSGRALWFHRHWHEVGWDSWAIRRGFLHSWYYHTLSGVRLLGPSK